MINRRAFRPNQGGQNQIYVQISHGFRSDRTLHNPVKATPKDHTRLPNPRSGVDNIEREFEWISRSNPWCC
jgi:hypothetical protein